MKSVDLTCTHVVRRRPEDVWAYVATGYFTHHASWDPAIVEMVKLSPEPLGSGTVGEEVRRFGGTQRARLEVTEFDEPKRFAFRNTTGPFDLQRSYAFVSGTDGTVLTFRFTMRPRGPATLAFPLLRRTIERQVRANIARLVEILDQT